MIKDYIYAFDIPKRHITAALSCPDEKTAIEVFLAVSRKMEVEYVTKRFHFGHARVCADLPTDGLLDDLILGTKAVIEYISLPRGNQKSGRLTSKVCSIEDFEFAESQTKEYLLPHKKRPLDLQFMYLVQLALEGKPFPEIKNTANSKRTLKSVGNPKNKSTETEKPRKKRRSKYEDAV